MIREANVQYEKKRSHERRDDTVDRRQGERRRGDRRQTTRRTMERRREICPVCSGDLTPTLYCPSCKMKVIKIRD